LDRGDQSGDGVTGVSEEKPHELLIIKRYRGGGEAGHHGGAWKIAFADFMTAMMALFLVLWLVSATTEKTKVSIARYFNPVKLVDMSTMKKGVSDPNENISTTPNPSGDGHPQKGQNVPQSEQPQDAAATDDVHEPDTVAAHTPTHSEPSLFRDPYAVLAEIVAAGDATEAKPDKAAAGASQAAKMETGNEAAEPFKDPFKIMLPETPAETRKKSEAGRQQSAETAAQAALTTGVPPVPAASAGVYPQPAPSASSPAASSPSAAAALPPSGADKAALANITALQSQPGAGKSAAANAAVRDDKGNPSNDKLQKPGAGFEAEAAKLQGEIGAELTKAFGKASGDQTLPGVEIKASDEGILISLTDKYNYSMFAVGSAEPQARTVKVMDKIAEILKAHPGAIIIRGHTDGRAYKTVNYDNWRLSSARAHMAHYMLTRGGLEEKRIEKIEGYADHKLKNAKNPLAEENRRIEILLRKDRT
jgi:chemotaxis protein MotB